jgi:hypothetical protein
MNGDSWVDQIIAQRPKSRQRRVFVCAGALAVADNVSRLYGRHFTYFAHLVPCRLLLAPQARSEGLICGRGH